MTGDAPQNFPDRERMLDDPGNNYKPDGLSYSELVRLPGEPERDRMDSTYSLFDQGYLCRRGSEVFQKLSFLAKQGSGSATLANSGIHKLGFTSAKIKS
jgi:hypothetical protein